LLGVALSACQFDVGFDVAGERLQFLVGGELIFDVLAVAENALRFFLIAPEIGVGGVLFEGFQARAVLGSVKESSARERCAASILHTGAANLQESCGV
jgi:hypothetical protein